MHLSNVVSMLNQRRRRWVNIGTILGEGLVLAGNKGVLVFKERLQMITAIISRTLMTSMTFNLYHDNTQLLLLSYNDKSVLVCATVCQARAQTSLSALGVQASLFLIMSTASPII